MSRLPGCAACSVALTFALAGPAHAQTPGAAAQAGGVIRACVKKKGGQMRMLLSKSAKCRRSERRISWNSGGPSGAPGAPGANGAPGAQGIPGPIAGTPAGGALTGTFPNPMIADGAVGAGAIAATLLNGSPETPTLRSLGSEPEQAAAGDDPRLSDARAPLDNSVTGAKVADGTLRIPDLFALKTTQVTDFPSIPASSCTGSSIASAVGSPGDIVFGFAPPDLGDALVIPPIVFGTAGEIPLKVCNVGATPIDPPSQTYTLYVIRG